MGSVPKKRKQRPYSFRSFWFVFINNNLNLPSTNLPSVLEVMQRVSTLQKLTCSVLTKGLASDFFANPLRTLKRNQYSGVFVQDLDGIQHYKTSHFNSLVGKKKVSAEVKPLRHKAVVIGYANSYQCANPFFLSPPNCFLASGQYETHYRNAGNQKQFSLHNESWSHSSKNVPCQLIAIVVIQKKGSELEVTDLYECLFSFHWLVWSALKSNWIETVTNMALSVC